ncbi:MAG: hypothetical protein ABW051_09155 [Burkholderiaceae bacterium]
MSRTFFMAAFAAGLAVLGWIAFGFLGTSWLSLAVTAAIAGAYLVGAWELRTYRAHTGGLRSALEGIPQAPENFAAWLEGVPPALRDAVRSRVEGGRTPLPGPALAPYLVGLLVMLGMLGTFLGLIITFRGAVFVLEGSADVAAIRAALSEPIKGLGLSFGTSVAGVAASAMLGLMSAIARRERLEAARLLDRRAAGVLAPFSLAHQRQAAFDALRAQSQALPGIVAGMAELMARIEARSQRLDEQLLQGQEKLQREVTASYAALADKVGTSLQASLAAGAQAAGEAIRPVVEATMAQATHEAQALRTQMAETAKAQAGAFAQEMGNAIRAVETSFADRHEAVAAGQSRHLAAWTEEVRALGAQLQEQAGRTVDGIAALKAQEAERAGALLELESGRFQALHQQETQRFNALQEREARLLAAQREQDGQRLAALREDESARLAAQREDEARRSDAAIARLAELQEAVARHLASLGASLEGPMSRLIHTASEVPQAAAGVIGELRGELAKQAERENHSLAERNELLEQLRGLMKGMQETALEQRTATEALSASAAASMQQAGETFANVLQAQAAGAGETTQRIGQSALEVGRLAETFQQAVGQFEASNEKLVAGLERIEASLTRSTERSDEQLAYYVAQAREVIDLSIASQQGLVEQLHEARGHRAKGEARSQAANATEGTPA